MYGLSEYMQRAVKPDEYDLIMQDIEEYVNELGEEVLWLIGRAMDMLGVDEWRSPNGDDRLVQLIADYDLYHTDVADALEQVLGKRITSSLIKHLRARYGDDCTRSHTNTPAEGNEGEKGQGNGQELNCQTVTEEQ